MSFTPLPYAEAEIAYRRERIMAQYHPKERGRRLRFPRRRDHRS